MSRRKHKQFADEFSLLQCLQHSSHILVSKLELFLGMHRYRHQYQVLGLILCSCTRSHKTTQTPPHPIPLHASLLVTLAGNVNSLLAYSLLKQLKILKPNCLKCGCISLERVRTTGFSVQAMQQPVAINTAQ